jgi:hypothetical protein
MLDVPHKVVVLYAKGLLGKLPSFAEANLIYKYDVLHDAYDLGVKARQKENQRNDDVYAVLRQPPP